MPFYHKVGKIPRLKHCTFYKEDGKSLYREELVSSKGFSGIYSNKYHIHAPTAVLEVNRIDPVEDSNWPEAAHLYYHFDTDKKKDGGNYITARKVFLQNNNCTIGTARVTEDSSDFYRNAGATEYIFIHHGKGSLCSDYGRIDFVPGDQLIIPRAITYQMKFDNFEGNKLLIVESSDALEIPAHFRNPYGQLEEHAPYAERDFKLPEFMEPNGEKGQFRIIVKVGPDYFEHLVPYHPFGVVGWDGYFYPYAFNIKDYHPKVGRIHLPPPIHLAFTSPHFVLCNFVPRPFDFHPEAIPAPYFHSNVDSDEVLYYVEGEFMSRQSVKEGSITLHPGGMPHGPQPGRTEASIGATETKEYAVMIDTFAPLRPTLNVKATMYDDYAQSWLE